MDVEFSTNKHWITNDLIIETVTDGTREKIKQVTSYGNFLGSTLELFGCTMDQVEVNGKVHFVKESDITKYRKELNEDAGKKAIIETQLAPLNHA